MESIAHLMKQLPEGYEQECIAQNAIKRMRGIASPADLMMLALFHLHNGCSLIEISEIGKLTKLGQLSDVAFMKRFEQCGDWFRAINAQMASEGIICYGKPAWLEGKTVIAVDASDVSEKGRSGRIYRLHYALDLFRMGSVQHKITTNATGESLCNFDFQKGQLVIADRGYASIKGISHCMVSETDYLIRLRSNCFTIRDASGQKIELPTLLENLEDNECLDLQAHATNLQKDSIPIRICAKRKTPEAIEQSRKKLRRNESKKQFVASDETRSLHDYIVLATSLDGTISAEEVLETYRLRWQVEIFFKRLKSIMDFGELPKRREKSVIAWLNGKIMIALLIERMIASMSFPPTEHAQ